MSYNIYCCECGYGPFASQSYGGCTMCQHTFCSSCVIVYPKKKSSERTDIAQDAFSGTSRGASSIQSEGEDRSVQLSTILGDVNTQPISEFAISKSNLTLTSDAFPSLASDHEDACSAVRSLPAQQIIANPEQSASGGEEKPVDGEWFWECCKCAGSPGEGGPWLLSTTPSCLSCDRPRCTDCRIWEA
jgi:hypothetical protein